MQRGRGGLFLRSKPGGDAIGFGRAHALAFLRPGEHFFCDGFFNLGLLNAGLDCGDLCLGCCSLAAGEAGGDLGQVFFGLGLEFFALGEVAPQGQLLVCQRHAGADGLHQLFVAVGSGLGGRVFGAQGGSGGTGCAFAVLPRYIARGGTSRRDGLARVHHPVLKLVKLLAGALRVFDHLCADVAH
ncbi:hypothetical protein D3C71_1486130 [compost metagenome]